MSDEQGPGTQDQPVGGHQMPELPAPPDFPPPPGGWEVLSPPAAPAQELPARRRGRGILAAILAGLLLLGGVGIGWGLTRGFGGGATPSATQAPLTAAKPSVGHADQALNVNAVAGEGD